MTKRILMELYYLERGILFHFISPKWGMKEGCDNIFSRLVDIALLTKYHFSHVYNIILEHENE
jgi:hypothetical protein